ncbi:MAG: hypothetical protein QNL04_01770 [SAR324 cluster bacterium]|nr:hypothetical protein [SAR324 cluster bacterium]
MDVKIVLPGSMPPEFELEMLSKFKSNLINIIGAIEHVDLSVDSDLNGWGYSDELVGSCMPAKGSEDVLLGIANLPLEENWYLRKMTGDRAVVTFHEMRGILSGHKIPRVNLIFNILYFLSLVFLANKKTVPSVDVLLNMTHDVTRGCLFDMTGLKMDTIHSCHEPIICVQCEASLRKKGVAVEAIETCQKEIKKIKKPFFYILSEKIKNHPIISIALSLFIAFIVGLASSVLGTLISNKLSL